MGIDLACPFLVLFGGIYILGFVRQARWALILLAAFGFGCLLIIRYESLLQLVLGLGMFLFFVDVWFFIFFSDFLPIDRFLLETNLRMTVVFFSAAVFSTVTDPFDILKLLRRLKIPEAVSLPVYIVLRFLPEIERQFEDIKAIQRLKGATWKNPGLLIARHLIPLTFVVLERANELSIAYYLRRKNGRI